MPLKIIAYQCCYCRRVFTDANAVYFAQQCEKTHAVREAHESGLHAWYCLNCKGFYKGEINNAKCPKCGNIGKRICRPKCRGKLDILGVDLSLIDKEVKLEIIDDTENQEKPF